ncbi:MAG: radical SAM family heme chaperone HemW [Polyangiaceae bacterium]
MALHSLTPRPTLTGDSRRRFGVYVHFPWCLAKCPYCDFVSFATERSGIDHRGYADAVIAELARRRAALEGARLETVFFGGGTPSLWEPAELGRVLAAILAAAPAQASEVEITVECNPTSLDETRARALRAAGVNRLSVGVQGLDEARLAFLGRLHQPEGGLEALRGALRSGMPRVSGDLIYGVGGRGAVQGGAAAVEETADQAADEARRVAETGVGHLSAYALTLEPATQFGELARRNRLPLAQDDTVAESFERVDAALGELGYQHYETSNYARPGEEARHNLGYWRGDDYLGLGCGAYGTLSAEAGGAVRYRNAPDPARYLATAAEGDPAESREALDGEARLRERIMLGLRIAEGFDLEGSAAELGVEPWPAPRRRAADRLLAARRIEIEGGRVRLPRPAWLFADGIAAELF